MADVTTRWTRIQTLFEQAIERPPDEQSAWLRAQCGEDPELYREVEALLEGDANQHTLFEGRVSDLLEPADFDAALTRSHDGERVGPWVLGERIGEGGMGAVYRADRADGGYDQTAALKLIKPGMDSEAVVARFRAERQILARLEHPGIARLLDGGLTDQGRPYFAMELVEGEPITAYADDRQLDVGARLRLFVTVCEAVRYAHRQLVVHRDLKPSNILVSPEGEVKLLDFGIARLLEDDSDLELTRTGQRMLTPSYAAPEQLRGEPPTTATDVYALGGLLYRLLCGAPPIDTEGRSVAEVELAVLNETPKRPSERVTMDVTRQRGASEDELAKRLRGDLDVICLKALEKDPERRYGSAGELLSDIQRHLEGQPIEARPATRRYRAGLFMKRHRAGVLGTAAAVIALVALTGFYTNRLANERDRAEAEADKAEQVSEFLQSLFGQASPTENEGRELTASEILALGAARIEEELADEPEVQATMFRVVGEVYRSLGKYDEAVQWGQKSVQLWTEIGPRDRPQRALALSALARAIQETGEFPTADSLHSEALAILRRTASADSEELVRGLEELSWLRQQQGQLDAAIELRRESVSILKEQAGENNRRTAIAMGNLANTLREKGDYEEAEPLFRRTLELYDKLFGPRNPETATVKNNLALMLNQQGRHADAVPLYREVLAIDQETLEPDHPYIAISQNNLGQALHGLGEYEESEQFFRAALALRREVLGPEHPATAESMHNLSQLLRDADRIEEAEALDRRAVELFEQALGPEHPRTALTTVYHGDLLRRLGRLEEADIVLRTATERIAAAFDSTHSRQSDPLVARAEWHLASGNADEGLRLALQAVAIRQRELESDHPNLLLAEAIHAEALAATGDRAGAVRLFDDVIEQIIARDGAAHPRVRNLSARREALQNR